MFIDRNGTAFNDNASILISNGTGTGPGERLAEVSFEPGMLRPYINANKQHCVALNTGRYKEVNGILVPVRKEIPISDLRRRGIDMPVNNAAGLTKDAWIRLDRAVIRATRQRLRAWADLSAAAGRGGFDAMSAMTLEYQSMTDPGEAVVDMDGLADGRTDRPLFDLKSVPLPITHSDFFFSMREIAVSRRSGAPLDTTMAEAAGRRVAEMIERTLIGTETGISFGTNTNIHTGLSKVYGYTNFPYRIVKTDLSTPTGANPEAVMTDVLEMIEVMQSNGFFGPYMLYTSTGYSRYLNDDYFRSGSTSAVRSLRERIMSIEGIADIRRLDFLTSGYQMILVQMSPEVAEAINGMEITTVQWESQGGLRQNFKVLAIQVPLLKTPYNGVAGILHATTS